jgi:hypothetical protein
VHALGKFLPAHLVAPLPARLMLYSIGIAYFLQCSNTSEQFDAMLGNVMLPEDQ